MTMKTRQLKTYGMQQKQFKREIYSNTILPQETRKTSNRQPTFTPKTTGKRRRKTPKINKETQVLYDTLDEIDLIDIFRTFHPKAKEYNFFSSAHGTFSRMDHIFSHKSSLSK